ncbi:5-oxoprolinase-like protein [Dinothrombium tinctorium]|uniref:5-oxoprolinase-like protein n=1 Tax=Dinothrombium tinctorium TaxID=1965070 RepID=A0A3S3NPU3_9ACAR|nr:5-oxoprolinase-like protein [Dinothrombium tinctorium]RWS06903.1 5-oxoprolinase-like protein [Dinothrombium tinctorium]RWS06911.1 5-oxoprolinase-like protein [Dinothrombium tinctorium]
MRVSFSIDRGGTFTDVFAVSDSGSVHVLKLLSVDPNNYADAPIEGIRRVLAKETGVRYDEKVDCAAINWIRMGTTVATNALLERKGESFALLVSEGFRDILSIGTQSRPNIFDLKVECPQVLYQHVVEVEERVILKQDSCEVDQFKNLEVKKGVTGEEVLILKRVNEEKLKQSLLSLLSKGIKCLAVCLLHSYFYPEHEKQVQTLALSLGFEFVAISSEVMPMIKIVQRGFTTCADAYLTPQIQRYISGFSDGFRGDFDNLNVLFMQSDGGLTPMDKFRGSRAILSGPAGGVVGYAFATLDDLGSQSPIIGFDMGGTSTDVSRFSETFEHTFDCTTAGITIQAPQLDIQTVAAGGGSKLFFRSGLFVVGPESTGAYPGPLCYRNGGELSITDANLCLGRIIPKYFPKIFGKNRNEPLDKEGTVRAFEKLTEEINSFMSENNNNSNKIKMSVGDVAMGFIKVANEAMCRPIRSVTQGKGYDTSKHILACFGGAGGQHACAVAKSLGIKTVFIHRYASVLSAFGMALADIVHEEQEPASLEYCESNFKIIDERLQILKEKCEKELNKQGFNNNIDFEYYLNLRYDRTVFAVMTRPQNQTVDRNICINGDFKSAFVSRYEREFGFVLQNRKILIDDIRVRGIGRTNFNFKTKYEKCHEKPEFQDIADCYFENIGFTETKVYAINNLRYGHILEGPCILIDDNNTILVEPDCIASITEKGNIKIIVSQEIKNNISSNVDPIQLSIFSHRFMSIAEEMGKVLQRTSISTNIKERLDFSCALFGPEGGLVSNAPHIPVHLGSMQEAVRFQLDYLKDDLKRGDVILTNHPCAGGSHLPDLTVITPVFYKEHSKPVFFVASRGHHADIGGITPGSMPPHSTSLKQEGAAIISFKLVKEGVFQEKSLVDLFTNPANSINGARNLSDNISDLKAQIAANQKGINLVCSLIDSYGLNVVQSYMQYIQDNAELAVRDLLKQIARNSPKHDIVAEDYMDDGTKIKLRITIDGLNGTAVFDFTGSGFEVLNNCNTPKAVTFSAITYCLRSMVGYDIPLNKGCLNPIKIIIPKGSILCPTDDAAVVGGNVTTSQRVVDVVLKAFEVCAASQGCMNNVTFGDDSVGYYETIAGGAGAGPTWHGTSGVHTHMTNTRITDVEIIEKRYPIVVRKFLINIGSGGDGKFKGGDGVIRELLFRKHLTFSILSERRVFSPYGLHGGENGKPGLNLLIFKSGRIVNLGSKASLDVNAGDVFHVETPGGGASRNEQRRESFEVRYSRHKLLVNEYMLSYAGATTKLKRDTKNDRTDIDILKEHHKFLWDDDVEPETWEKRLAKKYYDKLFKEYCVCDLTLFKENKVKFYSCKKKILPSLQCCLQIAMRWRTEKEVLQGKGQFICADKKCLAEDDLKTWEVNFAYVEEGTKKNALVKISKCLTLSLL